VKKSSSEDTVRKSPAKLDFMFQASSDGSFASDLAEKLKLQFKQILDKQSSTKSTVIMSYCRLVTVTILQSNLKHQKRSILKPLLTKKSLNIKPRNDRFVFQN